MKGISFVILISLLLTLLTSCVKKHDLSQKEIFSIINEIVKDNNLSVHKAWFSFDPQLRSKAFLYEFPKNDKKFQQEKATFKAVQDKSVNRFQQNAARLESHGKGNKGK